MNKTTTKNIAHMSDTRRQEMLLFWRENPAQAAYDLLNVDLSNHQVVSLEARWFSETHYDIFTRGGGKTLLNAVTAALAGILHPGNRIGLIGPSFRQSKLIFRELEELWNQSENFQACTVRAPAWTPEECYVKFHAAPGRKPSWISALPLGTDGSKIRGSRFFWTLADELAQIDEEVLEVVVFGFMATSANPMINVRALEKQRALIAQGLMKEEDLVKPEANKFIGSSTAYYQYNHLWRRVNKIVTDLQVKYRDLKRQGNSDDEIRKGGLVFRGGSHHDGQIPHRYMTDGRQSLCVFNYKDLPEGFMNEASIENARLVMSNYKFLMEYLCYFPPDTEGFFRRHLLDACRGHCRFGIQLGPRKGMIYVMGIDPARTSDNFSIAIMEVDPDKLCANLVRVLTWNQKSFPFMHQQIRKVIRHYNIRRIKMDAGGGGTAVRDLMADRNSCPPGEKLILEEEFEEHRVLVGDKILAPLVQFSSGQWVHDANHNLKSGLEHGKLFIASKHGQVPGDVAGTNPYIDDDYDLADDEMDAALTEWASIVLTLLGNREHFDTPTKTQRKDRYSAILMAYDAAREELAKIDRPQTLASGFWGGARIIGR